MSNENHIEPTNAPTTKSGQSAPNEAGETNWEEHKAQRKLAKKAEKKSFSRPVAAIIAVVAVCASVAIASGFVGLIENGNQLPQTLQLAQVNAQTDVTRTQVVLDSSDNETATVVWSRKVDTAAIIVEGLAKLDDDTYRVWYEAAGEYTAVGELSVTHDGSEVWATLTGDIGSAQSVIVTIDSADATEPGTDIVAEIEL